MNETVLFERASLKKEFTVSIRNKFVSVYVLILVLMVCVRTQGAYPSRTQELATVWKESGGNLWAIGDRFDSKGRPRPESEWAWGPYQIRQNAVDDVNRKFCTSYTAKQCWGNVPLSSWIYREYMNIYATQSRLGRTPTSDDMSGIHNGGPNGYKARSTLGYRVDVSAKRAKLSGQPQPVIKQPVVKKKVKKSKR